MSKPYPGPYTFHRDSMVIANVDGPLAEVAGTTVDADATGQLLACAPELLQIAEDYLSYLQKHTSREDWEHVANVIAKAKGEGGAK